MAQIEGSVDTEPATDVAEAGIEYRAVVVCTEELCSYCRRPRSRYVGAHTYPSAEEARDHGQGLSHKVYGSSVHRVVVESRTVSPWTEAETPTSAPPLRR